MSRLLQQVKEALIDYDDITEYEVSDLATRLQDDGVDLCYEDICDAIQIIRSSSHE